MSWKSVIDNDNVLCYVNVLNKEVLYLQPSALKHHYNEHNVFEMWEGNMQRMIVKPSEDTNAGSVLCIVNYRGFYAELGYNLLGQTYDEWNIPDGFTAYDIFHAFCAKSGYYDYADYPIDTEYGIRDNWYTTLEFYEQGGYYAY